MVVMSHSSLCLLPGRAGREKGDHVDVELVRKTPLLGLAELRAHPELAEMRVLARGNRLSITPVEPREWQFITGELLGLAADEL